MLLFALYWTAVYTKVVQSVREKNHIHGPLQKYSCISSSPLSYFILHSMQIYILFTYI